MLLSFLNYFVHVVVVLFPSKNQINLIQIDRKNIKYIYELLNFIPEIARYHWLVACWVVFVPHNYFNRCVSEVFKWLCVRECILSWNTLIDENLCCICVISDVIFLKWINLTHLQWRRKEVSNDKCIVEFSPSLPISCCIQMSIYE